MQTSTLFLGLLSTAAFVAADEEPLTTTSVTIKVNVTSTLSTRVSTIARNSTSTSSSAVPVVTQAIAGSNFTNSTLPPVASSSSVSSGPTAIANGAVLPRAGLAVAVVGAAAALL